MPNLIAPDERQCPIHKGSPLRCGMCISEWNGDGDTTALAARESLIQHFECDDRFPPRYREATADHPEVLAWLGKWRDLGPRQCPSLLLLGNVGVGKTHQAYGALRAAVTGPRPTQWEAKTAADLLAELRPGGKDSEKAAAHKALDRIRGVGLLLVDDLGVGKASEWTEETIFRIIGGRYDYMAPTIFTSNLLKKQVKPVLGDRIASRLAQTCDVVVMSGDDRRRQGRAS